MTFSVLLVEDDELMQTLIGEALQDSLDIQLQQAYSYTQAQWWLDGAEMLDLVLLDNYLGDGEGIDLLPLLTQQEGSGADTPRVMMLSANNDDVFLGQCFERGASDYLIKPLNLGLLTLKVSALLREKRLQQDLDLKNQQLEHVLAENERQEMLARFTYDFIVKRATRPVPGVCGTTLSSHAFSGDLILRATAPDGRAIVMILDATRHGLSAAITLLPVVSTFQAMVAKGFSLQAVLVELNQRIYEDTPVDRFVCCIAVEVDTSRKEVAVWNGGMPPFIAVSNEGKVVHRVASSAMPLGVLEDSVFEVGTDVFPLNYCRYWLGYSDGLYEQRNELDEPLGRAALDQNLQTSGEATVDALMARLAQHANTREYDDDVTLCSIDPLAFSQAMMEAVESDTDGSFTSPTKLERGAFDWSLVLRARQLEDVVPPTLAMSLINELSVTPKFTERLFLVLSELVTNALDHGVLELDSRLKEGENGFLVYAEERVRRLMELSNDDWIALSLSWDDVRREINVCVADSGPGFDEKELYSNEDGSLSGRGLALVQQYTSHFEIKPPGNRVEVAIAHPG